MASDAGTSLLALLAYQNLRVAQSLLRPEEGPTDLGELLPVARIAAEALTRFTHACDAIAGGQTAAQAAMVPITSPVDEFWSMTRPRNLGEQRLRVMVVANLELELVQRVIEHVPEIAGETLEPAAALWRVIDLGSQGVVRAIEQADGPDEMSLYARRLLGESAVMSQRLVVRQPALRVALTGESDDNLSASTAVLDEVLAAVAARVGQLGLSV